MLGLAVAIAPKVAGVLLPLGVFVAMADMVDVNQGPLSALFVLASPFIAASVMRRLL